MRMEVQEADAEWAARLEESQAAAAAAKDGVRRELDAQIETITRRLNELSSAEARRERRRTELAEEVCCLALHESWPCWTGGSITRGHWCLRCWLRSGRRSLN
jgi:hypothetical protein